MFLLILGVVGQLGPVGIDFSAIPEQKPPRGEFKIWLVVHAANGTGLDYGRWGQYATATREDYMEDVEGALEHYGCKVKRCGDVLVVQAYKGSPVTRVEVRVKDAVGATPVGTLAPRLPPAKPKAVAPPPRALTRP